MAEWQTNLPNAVLRDELKQAVAQRRGIVTPHFLSFYFMKPVHFTPSVWAVKISFFGRLHIGCRRFNRKNTKTILDWAKGVE